jgi:hypothetical protein
MKASPTMTTKEKLLTQLVTITMFLLILALVLAAAVAVMAVEIIGSPTTLRTMAVVGTLQPGKFLMVAKLLFAVILLGHLK